jgi:hypothetical protein
MMNAARTPAPLRAPQPRSWITGASAIKGFALYGLSMFNHNEALVRLLDEAEQRPSRAENGGDG